MGEFDLIAHYFNRPVRRAALGVQDDCARLKPANGCQLAVSRDRLVLVSHVLAGTAPVPLGRT